MSKQTRIRFALCVAFAAVLLMPALILAQTSAPASAPTTRLVASLDVKDFGAETIRIGDLNGDGAPDLLLVQNVRATREITCLTALTVAGQVLWQVGTPSLDNGTIYSDLPVQVYDWDNDGRNEVLHVRQAKYVEPAWDGKSPRERATRYEGTATMLVLEGATGHRKASFPLPAPADDSFLFADLTGQGRREDLVVKDRYWNMWGISHQGKELWHWAGSTGHFPAVADVDDDGRDEVFVGFALIDNDGKVLFSTDPKGAHQDACYIVKPADGKWRLLFGNGGIHCLRPDGTVMWEHPLREAQHVVAGRFHRGSDLEFAVVDRTPLPTHRRDADAWAILYLYDLQGRELWRRRQAPGDWAIATVAADWFGPGSPQAILVYGQAPGRPAALYDGDGRIIETFAMQCTPDRSEADCKAPFYAYVANVWGDCRDEIILSSPRGLCIHANPRPLAIETLFNETLYPGM
ncbi:MAG TPA: hypothetical protein VLM89_08935 [Phycisphaerae bacterium]|nr:hypothetical protein [Phycisphaerae bacterium]